VWGALALLAASVCGPATQNRSVLIAESGRDAVPASYFGLHIHRAGSTTAWPSIPFATWRLWDTYAGWPWLEPSAGNWQWDGLDRLVQLADEHHVEVLLPLGLTPTWASARPSEPSVYGHPGFAAEPANLDDWRRYVEAVASRYAHRVHLYEIWDEPNLRTLYTGDIAQMVQLCREAHAIIKRIDPSALVVSPAATEIDGVPWLDRFLAAGGATCFEVVGYHLYVWPKPPETIVPLVARVQEVMRAHGIADRPFWNTETGWYISPVQNPHPEALSPVDAAATVARALVLARAAGVARFYWYAWDNLDMGLADRDGPRLAGRALGEVEGWLIGAVLDGCRRAPDGTWTCGIRRAGRARWIAWNPDGRGSMQPPPGPPVARRRDLLGGVRPVAAGTRSIEVTASPELLEPAE
jgi:hypothetical protein